MIIGIDARSIEGTRTGVGRILINLLRQWKANSQHQFILYFKHAAPADDFLHQPPFVLKKLEPLFGKESNAAFEHILLPKALKKDRPDIFFAPSYTAPYFCPVPFVVTIHDISYEVHPEWVSGADQFFRKFMGRHSAKKAASIITVSDFTSKEVLKHYQIPGEKVHRVYPALAPELLANPSRSDLDEIPKNPYTVFVGTFFNRRHIPELIEAFKIINQQTPFDLVLIGQDATHPAQNISGLIEETNKQAGRKVVHHLQGINDAVLTQVYKKASSVSLLSEYEGFGLPLLEGMSLGVPVVIAPNSSLEEVAAGSALVSDAKNPKQIAVDLLKVHQNQTLREELINKGRKRAQDFSWQNCALETLEIITSVL